MQKNQKQYLHIDFKLQNNDHLNELQFSYIF